MYSSRHNSVNVAKNFVKFANCDRTLSHQSNPNAIAFGTSSRLSRCSLSSIRPTGDRTSFFTHFYDKGLT